MVIGKTNLTNIVYLPNIVNNLILEQQKLIINEYEDVDKDFVKLHIEDTFRHILSKDCKRYLLTKSAFEVINRIKIDKIDYAIFEKLEKEATFEFIINSNTLYRAYFDGQFLRGMLLKGELIEGMGYMTNYDSFAYEIKTKDKSANLEQESIKNIGDLFLKILIFIFFAETEILILNTKSKVKTINKDKIRNDTDNNYIVVDSKWNTIVINNQGFKVSGHFRLQPCGFQLNDRKLIFIDEYKKNGYIRNAKN